MTTLSQLLAGLHILIVEDDALIAFDLAENFTHAGAVVIGPVNTVGSALRAIAEADRLDAAVVDLNLFGELAFPVADLLLERSIPFVFATGLDASDIPMRYAAIGHCAKPVAPANLAEAFSWLQRDAG
ncbi:CheY chemotaxis protein or a CheY-like REC (receiver) domain [Kaistia soli DSM 19436]|uniref:CheY chemotaxis protein or a CheY-like REC (Receiver) domain n=1 Tax=Kaistia soli DSM 19436 TaxID=1122133 RepID=A0A1M5J1C1_9HYPH|nr:response regulator [Kaistia soli]SHG34099.1 CheY chemotaxis protein or a CheY-like REC (receiver) domain [Kaistia soli DSM 19436]